MGLPREMAFVFLLMLSACGVLKEREGPSASELELAREPVPPEKAEAVLNEVGKNFVYGQGLGEAALTIGASVLFPPYAVYVLGNSALEMGGYERIEVTDALPEEDKRGWDDFYRDVTSVPGRAAAVASGEEYRTPEEGVERIKKILKEE